MSTARTRWLERLFLFAPDEVAKLGPNDPVTEGKVIVYQSHFDSLVAAASKQRRKRDMHWAQFLDMRAREFSIDDPIAVELRRVARIIRTKGRGA